MAKRRPPRFTPPTPILSRKEQRKRIAVIRAQRTKRTAPARKNLARANAKLRALKRGNAFETCHALLQETTLAEWTKKRTRPIAYWDESWAFRPIDRVAEEGIGYRQMLEWQSAFDQNRTITEYFKNRVMAIFLSIYNPTERKQHTFTIAAAAGPSRAMLALAERLDDWAEKYQDDEELFPWVTELEILARRDEAHPDWARVTAGRAEAREEKEWLKEHGTRRSDPRFKRWKAEREAKRRRRR